MKYFLLLIYNLLFVSCSDFHFENRTFEFKASKEIDTIIPVKIISNYINKYLNPTDSFLSLSYSFSNDDQKYYQKELIADLLKQQKCAAFSYNILNKIHQFRRGNKSAFNVILVDGCVSLM